MLFSSVQPDEENLREKVDVLQKVFMCHASHLEKGSCIHDNK